MTDSLVAFLQARLVEDERLVRDMEAYIGAYRVGEPYEDNSGIAELDAFPSYPWGSEQAELDFMAGPGHPARVLADVEAKRRIVHHHEAHMDDPGGGGYQHCAVDGWSWPCETLRLLALPYADHPRLPGDVEAMSKYRVGSREWHAEFRRQQRQFDRMWPWMAALSIAAAITFLVLVVTGVIPFWVLFL